MNNTLTEYLAQHPHFERPKFLDDASQQPRVLQVRRREEAA
jgi:hypothetical protein